MSWDFLDQFDKPDATELKPNETVCTQCHLVQPCDCEDLK